MARTFIILAHGYRVLETVKPDPQHNARSWAERGHADHPLERYLSTRTADDKRPALAPTWFSVPCGVRVGFFTNIDSANTGGCPINVGGPFQTETPEKILCSRLNTQVNIEEGMDEQAAKFRSGDDQAGSYGMRITDPRFQWMEGQDCVPNMLLTKLEGMGGMDAGVYECNAGATKQVLDLENLPTIWKWDIPAWKARFPHETAGMADGDHIPAQALLSEVVEWLQRSYAPGEPIEIYVYACGETVPSRMFMKVEDEDKEGGCYAKWQRLGPVPDYQYACANSFESQAFLEARKEEAKKMKSAKTQKFRRARQGTRSVNKAKATQHLASRDVRRAYQAGPPGMQEPLATDDMDTNPGKSGGRGKNAPSEA